MGVFSLNMRILKTYNSRSQLEYFRLLDEVHAIPGIFTKKRYLWNFIRPQDFYVNTAHWISGKYRDLTDAVEPETRQELLTTIETAVHDIMVSTPDEKTKRAFIWKLTKRCALLTIDTLPYISPDRLSNMVTGKEVITDEAVEPLLSIIKDLNKQLDSLQDMINAYQAMTD